MRCGNRGHIGPNCSFLLPLKPTRVNSAEILDSKEFLEIAKPEALDESNTEQGKVMLL